MKNNYVKVKIVGRNVSNYFKWFLTSKINIIDLKMIGHKELHIIVNKSDIKKLNSYSKTYKVEILEYYGIRKCVSFLLKYRIIFMCILFSIGFIYFLSNIIFSVDIVYNNQEIVSLLRNELDKYGIKKYTFRKDYEAIQGIVKNILDNNKDYLEWMEIVRDGTHYVVKVVERKKNDDKLGNQYQDIVASKDAIITDIKAYNGEKVKNINDYVRSGDVIISGKIVKPNGDVVLKNANGIILGEVWYQVTVDYPYYYEEKIVTGRNKDVLTFVFFDKKIPIFSYEKYKKFKLLSRNILENYIFPIRIDLEKHYEVLSKEVIYTEDEVLNNARKIAEEKVLLGNNKIKEIRDIQILSKRNYGIKEEIVFFVSVIEDISKNSLIEIDNLS